MRYYCSHCGERAEIVDQITEYGIAMYVIMCTNDLDLFEPGSCDLVNNGCTELVPVDPEDNHTQNNQE